jgi:tricarballylate dehydrogenase
MFPPASADSLESLAGAVDLDAVVLRETIDTYNSAVVPAVFDPGELDDCRTEGLDPAKSHWAQTIDTPPFFAYPLSPGITFTYLGLKVDERARAAFDDAGAAKNIFAAGEVMAGNILGQGYCAGTGMTIGAVFGRIAGEEAASAALGDV